MIEHMLKIIAIKDCRYGLGYGYLLTRVFQRFGVVLGRGTVATRKQISTLSRLEECEYVAKKGGIEVENLTQQMLQDQCAATERIDKLLSKI
ncbi:hypothetical protein HAX54_040133 [Datura stramonium]|uniref:Uncharacterized protein n=1 Tax=Datura stramonium TaxID=4076 RepID=A0ABS8VNS1_DATST|nr:hypothetical protein [Datura stramonium]